MRRLYLNIATCFAVISGFSQADSIYTERINSLFKGGINGWEAFCNKNIEIPNEVKKNNTQGMVVISFTLDESGNIKNPVIENSVCEACDREALRVLSLTSDKWKPRIENEKPVSLYIEVSISFNAIPQPELKPLKEQVGVLYENEKYEEALSLINKILLNQPYDSSFIMGKGIVLKAMGRTEEACKAFKRSVFLGYKESEQYLKQYCN